MERLRERDKGIFPAASTVALTLFKVSGPPGFHSVR